MGIVVNVSEPSMDYMIYGDKSHILSNYLQNQLQSIPQTFNEFGNRVYNLMLDSYNFINNKLIQYGIKNELKDSGINIVDDYISELTTFKELTEANITMQRWIMSNPSIRKLYINQDVDGYSSTYKNIFGKDIGNDDYNYRRVMDGVVVATDDGFYYKHYIDDLIPGDKELSHLEKASILTTWDAMDWILNNCKFDFTIKSDIPVKRNV